MTDTGSWDANPCEMCGKVCPFLPILQPLSHDDPRKACIYCILDDMKEKGLMERDMEGPEEGLDD